MNPDQLDPAEALALAGRSGDGLARRAASPWWYGPLYGLGMGVLVASPGFRSQLVPLGTALGLAIVFGAYAVWSRQSGLSVNGFRAGRTRIIALALLAVVLGLSGLGLWFKTAHDLDWAPFAAGVAAALAAWIGSRAWDAAWRADLREGR
jgi:hypothetical protein